MTDPVLYHAISATLKICSKRVYGESLWCLGRDLHPHSPCVLVQGRRTGFQNRRVYWFRHPGTRMLAVPTRLERATFGFRISCSIQLSYGTKPTSRRVSRGSFAKPSKAGPSPFMALFPPFLSYPREPAPNRQKTPISYQ